MYPPNQNGSSHRSDYPYLPWTSTIASPAGMYYPAPNTHPLPPRPGNNEDFYRQEAIVHAEYTQVRERPRGRQNNSQHGRYGPGDWIPDPRVGLGIHTAGHPDLVPPHMPHTSYHPGRSDHFALPLLPNRSITLDSSSTSGRRYMTPPDFGPSNHAQPHSGTRTASPLSNLSSRKQKRHDQAYAAPNGKPWPKGRVGGPPKAPLGGIGGKPWDERTKEDRSVSSPLPSSSMMRPLQRIHAVAEAEGPTFNGSPIIFKPPPSIYSPEDSPELPSPKLNLDEAEKPCRVPRKDAYPWPEHSPRDSPNTIPLPPSPVDPDLEKRGRRTWTSIASTDIMEPSGGPMIKGKRKVVVLSLPNEVSLFDTPASH